MLKSSSKEYNKLEPRVKKFKRFEKIHSILLSNLTILLLMLSVPLYMIINLQFFGRQPSSWEGVIPVCIGMAVWIPSSLTITKKAAKYKLEDDEWATFYAYAITDNLEKYSTTTNIGMRQDYRKKTVETAKDFLSCIRKRWTIGKFKLAQEHYGKPLSELKKNIEYRLIPTLKDGDDELLGKVRDITEYYLVASRKLTLEAINSLNEQMSSKLPTAESMKIGLSERLSTFFTVHRILKNGLFAFTLFTGCCFLYYVAVTHLQIPREYAFTGSIAVFIGLITIYFRRQTKE